MALRAHAEYNVDLGYWNAASLDRFGEPTTIRIDTGTLKYIPLSYDWLVGR